MSPGLRPSVFSPAELYACSASHQARIPLAAGIASSHLYCYAAQLQSVQPLLAWRHSYLLFKAITWRPSPAPVRGHQLFVVIWMKFTQILCRSTTVYNSVFLHSTTIILFCLVLGPFPVLAQVLSPLRLLPILTNTFSGLKTSAFTSLAVSLWLLGCLLELSW